MEESEPRGRAGGEERIYSCLRVRRLEAEAKGAAAAAAQERGSKVDDGERERGERETVCVKGSVKKAAS